ncbi:efflux RND transporter periplasmic adaptor subunit [Pokkaliibacter sp. MBI-7]|uniref:efflux RND transporter periplasmic adaptor subunit n=1 Tax=Pokkaliibacter sp. MBI-7 TaxID=3040600 RepID=UPI00244821EF|nr:efflux RND transporter periplasmic adaptor subunit [Pokkaliibacter sp. MBI-7]MDH2432730.1 efflux RND transporter periplasmic adaptor subunit [Pokkaliibacter sp. MBI-7]
MSKTNSKHTRRRPWLSGLTLAIVLAAGGYGGWRYYQAPASQQQARLTATVQRGDLENLVTATGALQPRDYVDVGAQVSGQLTTIHVEVGDQVKEGDLLAEIDPTVLQARVDSSRAQLRNLKAQLEEKQSQLTLAGLQYKRQKNLLAEQATSTDTFQTAEAELRSAKAQIEALKAQIDQTESTLRGDQANLGYARIYAPMSGTVVSISARKGQTLNSNQQAPVILQIADLSTMTVQTQVSEADISKLKVGMAVYFTTLGSQGRRWEGTLRKVEPTPTVTNNVVLYNALFDVPNPRGALMTQMTAQVFFVVGAARDALLVPAAALEMSTPRRREGAAGANGAGGSGDKAAPAPAPASAAPMAGAERSSAGMAGGGRPHPARVKVLKADGSVEERSVEVGVTNRIQAQILSGLNEGEQVLLPNVAGGNRSGQRSGVGTPPAGPESRMRL